ncbi:Gp37-like protein [Mycolicibacterium gilvum]|uniref:Gp37-like protein n=1 Tax=Mycolicibacterium gilvum TaxID=1804 RepID=UPI0040462949
MSTGTKGRYQLVEVLRSQLRTGTLEERTAAASKLADLASEQQTEIVVSRYDKFWRRVGTVGDYLELSADIPRNTTPTCDLVLKGGDGTNEGPAAQDPHIPAMRNCRKELVGITVEVGPIRWAGFVDHTKYSYKGGKRQLAVNCLGIYDILNYIHVYPSWFLPLQAQPISHAVYIGPIVSVIESMIAEQAMRLQTGMWEFVNQALSLNPDMRAWFGTLLRDNPTGFNALKTPIYVVRTPYLKDTSMLVARTVRMEKIGTVIEDMTKAYGVDVRMDLWMPGDPQPSKWSNLTHPTYVVSVKDRLPVTGPTDTILDSIIKTVVDVGGSFFGEIGDIIKQAPGSEGVFISELAGVDFEEPIAILVDGPDTPMLEFDIDDYHPRGHTMLLGGRSPTWVGAPGLTTWGHRPRGQTMSQQPDQHHALLAARFADDFHRNQRHPKQSAGRLPQRRLPRVPGDPVVRPPQRGRPIRQTRELPAHRSRPVQRRGDFLVYQPHLGYARMALGDSEVPQRGTLLAWKAFRSRRVDVDRAPGRALHRLCRARLHPRQPQRARGDHCADRRQQGARGTVGEEPTDIDGNCRGRQYSNFGAAQLVSNTERQRN